MNLKLTVYLNDGRELSGVYPYLCALARLEAAAQFPNFKDFRLEAATA